LDEGAAADEAFECRATNISDLSDEQSAIANEIIRSVENNAPQLMFLQGTAGAGETQTFRVILSERHRRSIRCLVSVMTGMDAVQDQGGQMLYSLFSLGIDGKRSSSFISNVGQGTARARLLLSARLNVIYEISILTPWVGRCVPFMLSSITGENYQDWDFGGRQLLFVGDLLQLPQWCRIWPVRSFVVRALKMSVR
jgi:hypothetical protein